MAKYEHVMLAHKFRPEKHLKLKAHWCWSEKLDGMRALWTGRELVSRTGKPVHAPEWFLATFPEDLQLDGELWIGRGQFQQTMSAVRKKKPVDREWGRVRYRVFDTPTLRDKPFYYRYHTLQQRLGPERVVPHWSLPTGIDPLPKILEAFARQVELGAEGIMLRDQLSPYEFCRSHRLLKVKPEDVTTAIVIGHTPGEGKHEGRLGALECRLENGVCFSVGTGFSDVQRENPPKPTSRISVKHMGLTDQGVPRFPVFNGVVA